MNVWRKVQQLHEAMRHIFDNDTSGFSGQFGMTVRYRCGQCNELSPVWIFKYLPIKAYLVIGCVFIGRYAKTIAREKGQSLRKR